MVSWSVASSEDSKQNSISSEISIGNHIKDAYSGPLYSLNATSDSWTFDNVVLKMNSAQVTNSGLTYKAHLNTYSETLMRVDNATWANIKSAVTASDPSWNCTKIQGSEWCGTPNSCDSINATLPSITITVNDTYDLTIPALGETYRQNPLGMSDWKCTLAISNYLPLNKTIDNQIILGTYFLASYYAQLNYDSMTV